MDRAAVIANLTSQLPSWADRQAVCRATGLVDVQLAGDAGAVWASIVEEAEAQGRLEALLLAAAKYRPRDRTLAVMAGLPPPSARGGSWGLWVAFGALALMAVVARWQTPSGADGAPEAAGEAEGEAVPAPAAPASAAAPVPVVETPAASQAEAPAAIPEAAANPVAAPAAATLPPPVAAAPPPVVPAPPPVAAAVPAVPPAAPASPPAEAPATAGRRGACGGGGYAYVASGRAPGQGQVWTVPGSIYVRSDYPKASNGWDSKAGVVCALPAGARVELADAPLRIEGGAVWVRVRPDKILLP